MNVYRIAFPSPLETGSFRLRLRARLGRKGLDRLGVAGLIVGLIGLVAMILPSFTSGYLYEHLRVLALGGYGIMLLGVVIAVLAQVIELGWRGYLEQDR